MAAFGLPRGTAEESAARDAAIQEATRGAIEAPLRVMEVALESMEVAKQMAEIGMPASASDAGVAALCARAAVRGAYLNVRINSKDLKDAAARERYLSRGAEIEEKAGAMEGAILEIVQRAMTKAP